MKLKIRPIRQSDNARVAHIIRTVMPEFDCVGPTYSISDPEVDDMYSAYQGERAAFYVIENEEDGQLYGVGGFGPLAGADASVCELRKMYYLAEIRGLGMGRRMLETCTIQAKAAGYTHMYLETVRRMEAAGRLYRKMGFENLDSPMGATGHSSCDDYMLKKL